MSNQTGPQLHPEAANPFKVPTSFHVRWGRFDTNTVFRLICLSEPNSSDGFSFK